jgi:hypothetical protein
MTTPDYESILGLDSGGDRLKMRMQPMAAAVAGQSGRGLLSSSTASVSGHLMGYAPLSQTHGGGELRRMTSITGYLEDGGLGLSRGDR